MLTYFHAWVFSRLHENTQVLFVPFTSPSLLEMKFVQKYVRHIYAMAFYAGLTAFKYIDEEHIVRCQQTLRRL